MCLVLASIGRDNFDGAVISNQSEVELDNVVGTFVEVENIGANVGVLARIVKIALDHVQELCALGEWTGGTGQQVLGCSRYAIS